MFALLQLLAAPASAPFCTRVFRQSYFHNSQLTQAPIEMGDCGLGAAPGGQPILGWRDRPSKQCACSNQPTSKVEVVAAPAPLLDDLANHEQAHASEKEPAAAEESHSCAQR